MVDLQSQFLEIEKEILAEIQEVFVTSQFIKGPKVEEFENNLSTFLGGSYVVGCGNGTDALAIAALTLDLKPGDEVITPSFSYIAAVESLVLLGIKPLLCDIDPKTFNIDVEDAKKRITNKTKAILPVHLFGQGANMQAILKLAKDYQLKIIEDNAQSLGAKYTINGNSSYLGTMGDIGTTSFFPTKNLGAAGDGGALMTNNEELFHKMKAIAVHGQNKKYHFKYVGMNSRLDAMQAAILNVKLKQLNNYIKKRQHLANIYFEELKDISQIELPFLDSQSEHVFHQFTIKVNEKRDELQEYLRNNGVPSMIYYPIPIHLQEAYLNFNFMDSYPVSTEMSRRVLSLPMHTEMQEIQAKYIINTIKNFFK